MERRPHRPGGFFRSIVRRSRNEEAARRADEELKIFKMGEPSVAFYPPHQAESDTVGHVVFVSPPDYIEPVSPIRRELERFFTFSKNEPLSSA